MKKLFFSVLVVSALFTNCKKKDDAATTCDATVAGIAANYKITKKVFVTTGGSIDVTTTQFDACQLAGVYQLKSDKTIIYTETGASCTGSNTGTWDVVSGKITLSGGSLDLTGTANSVANNCSNIVITEDLGSGSSEVYTLTKQ